MRSNLWLSFYACTCNEEKCGCLYKWKKKGNLYYSMNVKNRIHKFYTLRNQSFGTGGPFAGSKAISREADRSFPSSAEVTSGRIFTSTSPVCLNGVYGDIWFQNQFTHLQFWRIKVKDWIKMETLALLFRYFAQCIYPAVYIAVTQM
jgi:hypothetical protein